MTIYAVVVTKYLRLHHFYWDFGALSIKGLISENAQGISPGTLLDFEEAPPSYKKQQRKKLYQTKQGSTPWPIPLAIGWGFWSTLMETERTLINPYFLHFFNVTMPIIVQKKSDILI